MIQQHQPVFRSEDLAAWQRHYPEDTLIGKAIAGFHQFSQEYHGYFQRVIAAQAFDRSETTTERLRARASQTLEDYWAPLGEIAMQWRIEHYRELLEEGDRVAQDYVDRLRLPGALVYFNKVAVIKYLPYTSIAFVGTPYTRSAAHDWMAIPHELGHYLYWNLGGSLEDIRSTHQEIKNGAAKKLEEEAVPEDQRRLLLPWLEETFCDVVGTQIGGSEFAARFIDYLKDGAGNADELTRNDGHHPPPCLRPFVREHVLALKDETSGVDWDRFFRNAFGRGVAELHLETLPPSLKEAVEEMTKEELLRLLEAEEPPEAASPVGYQKLRLTEVIPAVETLVEYLSSKVEELLHDFQPPGEIQPFERLLDLATEDLTSQEQLRDPYEILLRPAILEGGEWHGPHDCWAHVLERHEVGEHAH